MARPRPLTRPTVSVMADELEVLLEPQRERERIAARRKLRLRGVLRASLSALVVLVGVGGLFVYSKRETLRLASELGRARAEGRPRSTARYVCRVAPIGRA